MQANSALPLGDRLAVDLLEAGRLTGLCSETVARACRRGELRHAKVGRAIRIRPADLDAWLQSHSVGGGPAEQSSQGRTKRAELLLSMDAQNASL